MFWNKKKSKKIDPEIEAIQEIIENKKNSTNFVCIGVSSQNVETVKVWCANQGYKMDVDHMTDGTTYYKFYGWE